MVKKLVLLVFSICFMLLPCEFVIRYWRQAWPFESALYVPDYLTTRDTTLHWQFSPSDGRNSLGLRNRELGTKKTGTYRILFLGDSQREISLVVLVFPVSDQVNDQYRKLDEAYVLYPQGRIREICYAYAILRLDMTESIHRNGGITLFRDNVHLNAKGNDVVTDGLEKYLVDKLGL